MHRKKQYVKCISNDKRFSTKMKCRKSYFLYFVYILLVARDARKMKNSGKDEK